MAGQWRCVRSHQAVRPDTSHALLAAHPPDRGRPRGDPDELRHRHPHAADHRQGGQRQHYLRRRRGGRQRPDRRLPHPQHLPLRAGHNCGQVGPRGGIRTAHRAPEHPAHHGERAPGSVQRRQLPRAGHRAPAPTPALHRERADRGRCGELFHGLHQDGGRRRRQPVQRGGEQPAGSEPGSQRVRDGPGADQHHGARRGCHLCRPQATGQRLRQFPARHLRAGGRGPRDPSRPAPQGVQQLVQRQPCRPSGGVESLPHEAQVVCR